MLTDPSLNIIHKLIRSFAGQGIVAQLRDTGEEEALAELRQNILRQFNDKLNFLLEDDHVIENLQEIPSQGYGWYLYLIPETNTFLRGLPRWSIWVSGYLNGKLHKTFIFEAHTGNYYFARKSGGGYEKAKRLHFSQRINLEDTLLAWHAPVSEYDCLIKACGSIINTGSKTLDFLDCLAGRVDIFYAVNCSPEFMAIARLFLGELGGIIADHLGQPLQKNSNSLLISGHETFEEVHKLLVRNRKANKISLDTKFI